MKCISSHGAVTYEVNAKTCMSLNLLNQVKIHFAFVLNITLHSMASDCRRYWNDFFMFRKSLYILLVNKPNIGKPALIDCVIILRLNKYIWGKALNRLSLDIFWRTWSMFCWLSIGYLTELLNLVILDLLALLQSSVMGVTSLILKRNQIKIKNKCSIHQIWGSNSDVIAIHEMCWH